MESIIAELFYGNITPSERSYRKTREYAHILQLFTRNEEKLTETLTKAQKETLEKFNDGTSEISSMTEVSAFTLGFKLGLRLTAEAFIGGDSDQELISEKFHTHRIYRVRLRFPWRTKYEIIICCRDYYHNHRCHSDKCRFFECYNRVGKQTCRQVRRSGCHECNKGCSSRRRPLIHKC